MLLGYIPVCDEKLEKDFFEKLIDFHIGRGWFQRSLEMEEFLDLFDEDPSDSEVGLDSLK